VNLECLECPDAVYLDLQAETEYQVSQDRKENQGTVRRGSLVLVIQDLKENLESLSTMILQVF